MSSPWCLFARSQWRLQGKTSIPCMVLVASEELLRLFKKKKKNCDSMGAWVAWIGGCPREEVVWVPSCEIWELLPSPCCWGGLSPWGHEAVVGSSVLSSCFFHRCEISNSVGRAPGSTIQGVSSDNQRRTWMELHTGSKSRIVRVENRGLDALEASRLGIHIHV